MNAFWVWLKNSVGRFVRVLMRAFVSKKVFRCFDDELLRRYEPRPPFYTHPYAHWRGYGLFKPADRLDEMAANLMSVPGFEKRLHAARQGFQNPTDFFGFVTEVKAAHHLRARCSPLGFIEASDSHPTPDLVADGIYVEINTPIKRFPEIVRLREELNKLDGRIRLERTFWTPAEVIEDYEAVILAVKAKLHELRNQELRDYPIVLWRSPTSGRPLVTLYLNSGEYHPEVVINAHGDPSYTLDVYLNESLKAKIAGAMQNGRLPLKNGLDHFHPNVLWSELLYLQDFSIGLTMRDIDWSRRGLPKNLDAQIITVCGIDAGYDAPHDLILLMNGSASTDRISSLEAFFSRAFPGREPIVLTRFSEDLGMFGN